MTLDTVYNQENWLFSYLAWRLAWNGSAGKKGRDKMRREEEGVDRGMTEDRLKAAGRITAAGLLLLLVAGSMQTGICVWGDCRHGEGKVALEAGLSSEYDRIHSDPDVHPVKGDSKALAAVEGLGGLPDLSLEPKKKQSAVVVAAMKAGVHVEPAKVTVSEKQRAMAAVEALIGSAEGKIKKELPQRYKQSLSKNAVFLPCQSPLSRQIVYVFVKVHYPQQFSSRCTHPGVSDLPPDVCYPPQQLPLPAFRPAYLSSLVPSYIRPLCSPPSLTECHRSYKEKFHAKMAKALFNYKLYKGEVRFPSRPTS